MRFQLDTRREEPYFCCNFILGLGSGEFIFLFVSLSLLIKRKKGLWVLFVLVFFLTAVNLKVHLEGVGGCSRDTAESPHGEAEAREQAAGTPALLIRKKLWVRLLARRRNLVVDAVTRRVCLGFFFLL